MCARRPPAKPSCPVRDPRSITTQTHRAPPGGSKTGRPGGRALPGRRFAVPATIVDARHDNLVPTGPKDGRPPGPATPSHPVNGARGHQGTVRSTLTCDDGAAPPGRIGPLCACCRSVTCRGPGQAVPRVRRYPQNRETARTRAGLDLLGRRPRLDLLDVVRPSSALRAGAVITGIANRRNDAWSDRDGSNTGWCSHRRAARRSTRRTSAAVFAASPPRRV